VIITQVLAFLYLIGLAFLAFAEEGYALTELHPITIK